MPPPNRTSIRKAPDGGELAFRLAAIARPHLSLAEADRIYVSVGIGDAFEAIDALIAIIARDRIPLGSDVVAVVTAWLDCYRGQKAEPHLRHLLDGVTSGPRQHVSVDEEIVPMGPTPAADEDRSV